MRTHVLYPTTLCGQNGQSAVPDVAGVNKGDTKCAEV